MAKYAEIATPVLLREHAMAPRSALRSDLPGFRFSVRLLDDFGLAGIAVRQSRTMPMRDAIRSSLAAGSIP